MKLLEENWRETHDLLKDEEGCYMIDHKEESKESQDEEQVWDEPLLDVADTMHAMGVESLIVQNDTII